MLDPKKPLNPTSRHQFERFLQRREFRPNNPNQLSKEIAKRLRRQHKPVSGQINKWLEGEAPLPSNIVSEIEDELGVRLSDVFTPPTEQFLASNTNSEVPLSESQKSPSIEKTPNKKASKVTKIDRAKMMDANTLAKAAQAYEDDIGYQLNGVYSVPFGDRFEVIENMKNGSAFVFRVPVLPTAELKNAKCVVHYGEPVPCMACDTAFDALVLVNAEQRAENQARWRAEQETLKEKDSESKVKEALARKAKGGGKSDKAPAASPEVQNMKRQLDMLQTSEEPQTRQVLKRIQRVLESYERPRGITDYVKRVRGTTCQLCGDHGFAKRDGTRYCEVHHLFHLSKNPPPKCLAPEYLVVLCATCHRRMHYANVGEPIRGDNGWNVRVDEKDILFRV